jgi:molybdenum cofactor synthesis domain-containing protein
LSHDEELTQLHEARSYVLARVNRMPTVDVSLDDAHSLVAAAHVTAREDVPSFANSAMDGYAVRSEDTIGAPVDLVVVDFLPAGGSTTRQVKPGEAIRIMTGGPIPAGADAVVMVERTHTVGNVVAVEIPVSPRTSIREAGEDVRVGDVILTSGTVISPTLLGVLSSIGVTQITAYRKPRVGVLSTGNELVSTSWPVGTLGAGQIRNSNGLTLRALLHEAGFKAIDLGIVNDQEIALASAIRGAAEMCDAIITTGGVSVGDLDFVGRVLADLGESRSMRLAIKPAKPFAFAVVNDVPVFGLPGNPVAAVVAFELLARPALMRMAGHRNLDRPTVYGVASEKIKRHRDGKTHYVRVVATQNETGEWLVRSSGGQGAHHLRSMANSNALAVVVDGDGIDMGERVETILLNFLNPNDRPQSFEHPREWRDTSVLDPKAS